jgi:hypothetical protein
LRSIHVPSKKMLRLCCNGTLMEIFPLNIRELLDPYTLLANFSPPSAVAILTPGPLKLMSPQKKPHL